MKEYRENMTGYTIDKNGYAVPNEPVHFKNNLDVSLTNKPTAWLEGYKSGLAKDEECANPFNDNESRELWFFGYAAGWSS